MSDRLNRLMEKQAQFANQRRLERESRLKTRADGAGESVEQFEKTINEKYDAVREHIANSSLKQAQAEVKNAIEYLSLSNYYLPGYTKKKVQSVLDEFEKCINEKLQLHQPAKRFSFNAKKVERIGNVPESVASPGGGADSNGDEIDDILLRRATGKELKISDLRSQTIQRSGRGSTVNSITIEHVSDGKVVICHTLSAVRVVSVKNSLIAVGPVEGSVHIEDCIDTTIIVASRQIRIHNSHGLHLYIYAKSNPIIEDCTGIVVAPYNLVYDNIDADMENASFRTPNLFDQVQDFKWLHDGQPPNWSIMPVSDRIPEFRPNHNNE